MNTEGFIIPKVSPRLFSCPVTPRDKAPRRHKLDSATKREFRISQIVREKYNPENNEFYSPEDLDSLRRYLTEDIRGIEIDLIPLKKQYDELKEKEENNTRNNAYDETSIDKINRKSREQLKYISIQMKQSNVTLEGINKELARLRRDYCQANRIRLEDEIDEHKDEIYRYTEYINSKKLLLQKYVKERDDIVNSEKAEMIRQQKQRIDELRLQLDELIDAEQQYIKIHEDMVDDIPVFMKMNKKVEYLQNKLINLGYKKTGLKVQFFKMRKQYEEKKKALKMIIQQQKDLKYKEENQEAWRDKLGIPKELSEKKTRYDVPPDTNVHEIYDRGLSFKPKRQKKLVQPKRKESIKLSLNRMSSDKSISQKISIANNGSNGPNNLLVEKDMPKSTEPSTCDNELSKASNVLVDKQVIGQNKEEMNAENHQDRLDQKEQEDPNSARQEDERGQSVVISEPAPRSSDNGSTFEPESKTSNVKAENQSDKEIIGEESKIDKTDIQQETLLQRTEIGDDVLDSEANAS